MGMSPDIRHPILLPHLEEMGDMPLEDGPLFRAHVKEMEERALCLRRSLKQIVKSSEAVLSAQRTLDDTEDAFDRSIHQLAESNPYAVLTLNDAYWKLARQIQGFARKESILRLEELVIDPLRRIEIVLKTVDTKKKDFEQESKAYYDHITKVGTAP